MNFVVFFNSILLLFGSLLESHKSIVGGIKNDDSPVTVMDSLSVTTFGQCSQTETKSNYLSFCSRPCGIYLNLFDMTQSVPLELM